MRNRNIQRVQCLACTWSGGRAAGGEGLALPCAKCGGRVEPIGDPYVEERVLAGCASCQWWGEVQPTRVGRVCVKCGTCCIERVYVVNLAGTVLA